MDTYLESENEENDNIILNDNGITFEYDCEALKKMYKIFFLQNTYYISDDEDSLPTVKNTSQEQNNGYSTSIKISEDRAGYLFAFDEALEIFGVKFIKSFINGNVIDEDNMKSQISAAQTEHERISVLFSEYLNDTTIPHGARAIKTHKETMLVNHLLDADDKVLECNLWKITKPCALNPIGVQRLFDCYSNGHEIMNSICRQEVFGAEKIETKGRRALNVTKTTMKNVNENKKATKKTSTQFSDTPLEIQPIQIIRSFSESSYLQTQTQPHLYEVVENVTKKRSRCVTTLEAKNMLHLLIQLIQQGEEVTEEKISAILPTLNMKQIQIICGMLIELRIIYYEITLIKSKKILFFFIQIIKVAYVFFFENSAK